MQSFKAWLFPAPVQCKTAAIMTDGVNVENPAPTLPKMQPEPTTQPKSETTKTGKRRKTTIKKLVPTVSSNGFIGGCETLVAKNQKEHPQNTFLQAFTCFMRAPILAIPYAIALAPMEMMRYLSDSKHKKSLDGKKALMAETPAEVPVTPALPVVKSSTAWDGEYDKAAKDVNNTNQAPLDYDKNEFRLKSMKAEKLSSRHLASNCAVELELFKVCLKDRFHSGTKNQCRDLLDDFKKCQE